MGFKAVLFDLDGTLLDTLKDLALSVNAVLRKHGYREHPVESYRYFVGEGIEALARRAVGGEPQEGKEPLERLVAEIKEEYGRRWSDHTAPYPGIPELLDNLERKGVPKAILSNKPHDFTKLTVGALLASWKFDPVQGARPGAPTKPDPAGALLVAKMLGLSPGDFVYLGDTATDMKTAVAAGMYPLGALWGFRPAEELKQSGAVLLLEHPRELLELLD